MKNVLAYIRVSTKTQADMGTSLSVQEQICQDFADRNGYKIIHIFSDQGESAKTANRPELIKMMDYCKKHKKEISAIIIYKVDRFARRSSDYLNLRPYFRSLDINVISATEPFEDNPIGRLMESNLASWAQFDNEIRAERSITEMIKAIHEGRWPWQARIGYINSIYDGKKNIAHYEPQAKYFPRIFELIVQGYNPEAVRNGRYPLF